MEGRAAGKAVTGMAEMEAMLGRRWQGRCCRAVLVGAGIGLGAGEDKQGPGVTCGHVHSLERTSQPVFKFRIPRAGTGHGRIQRWIAWIAGIMRLDGDFRENQDR